METPRIIQATVVQKKMAMMAAMFRPMVLHDEYLIWQSWGRNEE
jgi:hypothetical protein